MTNRNGTGVSLLERDMVDHLEYIALSVFSSALGCFKMIIQLLDSDWPNILAGLNFWAQENGLMSPDGVCAISTGPARHKTNVSIVVDF